jgi:hypothetical protein
VLVELERTVSSISDLERLRVPRLRSASARSITSSSLSSPPQSLSLR